MPDVSLVHMPLVAIERPAIGLGVLKSALRERGITSRVHYANLAFAEEIGVNRYHLLDGSPFASLVADWLFAGAAFPEFQPDSEDYLSRVEKLFPAALLATANMTSVREYLWSVRQEMTGFVDRVARRVLADAPRIVGCSSTFRQHCASIALLRRIRELAPGVVTVIGGGNCDGSMGQVTADEFPWIDYVFSGEAEAVFPEFCAEILAHGKIEKPSAGVLARGGSPSRATVLDLDQSPIPDYRDYFESLRLSPLRGDVDPGLLIETSRGCWWGQKHHCTFCGLNGEGMSYRSKSPDRALQEFESLAAEYGIDRFEVVDNILDAHYPRTLMPKMSGAPYNIFVETKANLKRAEVEALANAGVRWIQPGIESLSDRHLKLLSKGTTVIANVQLLKWCLEYGIRVMWYLLWRIPGDAQCDYTEVAEWLPMIEHLHPPSRPIRIRIDRFSPYYTNAAQYGLDPQPFAAYAVVYPLTPAAIEQFAYFFEDARRVDALGNDEIEMHPGVHALEAARAEWAKRFWVLPGRGERPILQMVDDGTSLRITDTRRCAVEREVLLSGIEREICLACGEAPTLDSLTAMFASRIEADHDELVRVVAELVRRKLLLETAGRYLLLATAPPRAPLPYIWEYPGGIVFGELLRQLRMRLLPETTEPESPHDLYDSLMSLT